MQIEEKKQASCSIDDRTTDENNWLRGIIQMLLLLGTWVNACCTEGTPYLSREGSIILNWEVTLAQLVKASVGQADVQRFEPHLRHNLLSCGVFLVKSRHFGLHLAPTLRPNWQSLLAGGSVAIQTWSIYKVYT